MERSDETKRKDSLYDRLGSAQRKNRKLEEQIKHLEVVIAAQKQTIKNQGIACEERHNILCGIKENIDEYFGDT